MNHCGNCGAQLKNGAMFCSECGVPINEKEEKNIEIPLKRRRNITFLVVGISMIAIIGILIGGFVYGSKQYSEKRVVDEFLQGLREENVSLLNKHVVPTDKGLVVSSETLTPLFTLIKSTPSKMDQIEEELYQQLSSDRDNLENSYLFQLKRNGKHFFIFDRYIIVPRLYFVKAELEGENIQITVNGKEVGSYARVKKTEIGPFFPGNYIIEGYRETEYVNLIEQVELTLFEKEMTDLALNLEGTYVTVDSNDYTANLFVNGRDTGKKVGELRNFGPVLLDGSIILSAIKYDQGKSYESNVVPLNDTYVFLEVNKSTTNQRVEVVPVYNYIYSGNYSGFLFPDSNVRKLSSSEVARLNSYQLYIARNEIFARYGYVFELEDLRRHFGSMPWYYENPHYDGSINSIEQYNVSLIQKYE